MTTVRLAGAGGQGIQRAGIVLAEAAIASGRNAVCAQTYGPESRGGASRCDVIVSDGEIVFPRPRHPDVLVALSRQALQRFVPDLRPDGLLICDSGISGIPDGTAGYALPIVVTAGTLRAPMAANVVALGALWALQPLVTRDALEGALRARIRGDAARIRAALDAGIVLGLEAAGRRGVEGVTA